MFEDLERAASGDHHDHGECDHKWIMCGVNNDKNILFVECKCCGVLGSITDADELEWAYHSFYFDELEWAGSADRVGIIECDVPSQFEEFLIKLP